MPVIPPSKILPLLILGGGAFALAYYFVSSAKPKPGTVPLAPIANRPAGSENASTTPAAGPLPTGVLAMPKGVPPTVPGYDVISVPCSSDGQLNVLVDTEIDNLIERSEDPAYLDRVAAALRNASPPCSAQAVHAEKRAKLVRDAQAAAAAGLDAAGNIWR